MTDPILADAAAVFTPSISERRSSTTTYFHNGFKNAESQTIANETVSATQTFDAFGLPDTSSGTWKGPFAYGGPYGYQSDSDSGLMLLGHRYYDSSTVRFLSRDPIKHGRNWYGYCGNNPLARVDTTGNVGVAIGIVVVLVVGGIAIYIGSVRGGDSAVDAGSSATTTLPSYAIPSPAGELAGPIGAEGPLLSIGQNRLKHKGAIDDLTGYNGEPNYTGPSDSLDTDENCNKGLYLQDPNPGPNPILTGPPSGRHPTFILKAYNDSAPLGPALPPRPVPPAVGPPASINGGRPGNILYG